MDTIIMTRKDELKKLTRRQLVERVVMQDGDERTETEKVFKKAT